jgi:hypothetical protein
MAEPVRPSIVQESLLLRCGEVVGAQVSEFEARCDQLHAPPPLGSLVRVSAGVNVAVYGLVAGITTGGVDSGMRPIPRGREGCEDADVFRAHPDLAHLLATSIRCLVVGFRQNGRIYRFLPSAPASIHFSVITCTPDEISAFCADFGYVSTLLAARDLPVEEVVAAHIRYAAEARDAAAEADEPAYQFTIRAGRTLAQLLRSEQQRLNAILQRIRRLESPTAGWRAPDFHEPAAQALAP